MFELIKDLIGFAKTRQKFLLLPIIFLLVIFGGMLILAESSVVAPFIYTVF